MPKITRFLWEFTMPSKIEKVNAAQFRRLSEYIRKSSSSLTRAVSDNALANVMGVNNMGIKGQYVSHDELTNREKRRIEQIQDLTPLQRSALICQASLYGGVFKEMNQYLLKKKRLPLKRIKFDSNLPRGSQGKALSESSFSIDVQWSSAKRISYARFPHSLKYRNPDLAKPYNMHWGASRKFARYAVTSVNVFGKSVSAGLKGTELEGLGSEPIGFRPKEHASIYRYKFFKRVGYPGRRRPDRVTIKHRYPVYIGFFSDQTRSKKVLDKVQKDGNAFAKAYAKRQKLMLIEMTKKLNKELSEK